MAKRQDLLFSTSPAKASISLIFEHARQLAASRGPWPLADAEALLAALENTISALPPPPTITE